MIPNDATHVINVFDANNHHIYGTWHKGWSSAQAELATWRNNSATKWARIELSFRSEAQFAPKGIIPRIETIHYRHEIGKYI